MGYYTYHDMTVRTGKHKDCDIMEAIQAERNGIFYGIDTRRVSTEHNYEEFELYGSDNVKWYDEESDMIEFSRKFPDAIFTVHGTGEEQGDVWEHEYQNGCERYRYIKQCWTEWSRPEFKHENGET